MSIELGFTIAISFAMLLLLAHARWTLPHSAFMRETVDVGHVASAEPPPLKRDVLDDYEAELGFIALTPEGSADHRLALIEALLQEADQETTKLELLVDKIGCELLPAA